jgi:hypothetical protein
MTDEELRARAAEWYSEHARLEVQSWDTLADFFWPDGWPDDDDILAHDELQKLSTLIWEAKVEVSWDGI